MVHTIYYGGPLVVSATLSDLSRSIATGVLESLN